MARQFSGPLEEFLKADISYRKGDYEDAINWSKKVFKSTLKGIGLLRLQLLRSDSAGNHFSVDLVDYVGVFRNIQIIVILKS
jgi:hypothetical protein